MPKLDLPYRRCQQLCTAVILRAIEDHQSQLNGGMPPHEPYDPEEVALIKGAGQWLRDPANEWIFKAVGLDQAKLWTVMDKPGLLDTTRAQIKARPRRMVRDEI